MQLFYNGDMYMCESHKATLYLTDSVSHGTTEREKTMRHTVPREVNEKLQGPAGNEITG